MKQINAGSLALTLAALVVGATSAGAADDMQKSIAGTFHLTPARGPVRPVDLSPFKGPVSSEILAGPTNGLESSYLIYTRMAPKAPAMGLYTLPVDHTYLVLSGKLNVQLGTDQFVAEPDTLVFVPAGVPHQAWNAGSEPEADFQAITPAPSRDLVSLMKPASARKIENAARYIHVAPALGKLAGGTGHESLNERILVSRESTGSDHVLERLNDMLPGGGRTELHLHPFDQVYFIKQGTMKISYGAATYEAKANSLVVLPVGVVHSNENAGSTVQSVITLLLPEPPKGVSMGGGIEARRTGEPGQGAGQGQGQRGQGQRQPRPAAE
jgi:mannose-6-phosphate isomerase-like protein (cupin superfamily)